MNKLCAMGLVFVLLGCGASSDRLALEGVVTFDGKPVPFGTIQFDPDTQKGASGVQGSAEIVNGRYKTLPDMGPARGPHIARVTGYERRPESPNDKPLFAEVRIPIDVPADAKTLDLEVPAPKQK